MIDLHSHTTASDGQYTPDELMSRAAAAGVTVLAVTDHDTVAGLEAAGEAARRHGMVLVPGIEVSAFVLGKEVHILGHFVRPDDEELARFATRLRAERERRMEAMVERMRQLGFPVRMEHVRAVAGDAQLGRPHLARVLVDQGWAVDMKAAFDRFLGTRGMAWVDRFKLEGAQAIRLIRKAGGTATLAHPAASKVERMELRELAKAGLAGLEMQQVDPNPGIHKKYLALAREFDLVPTAGSDFHGEAVAPEHRLGSADMPAELFAKLQARASA
ncbi:PHP domain-containing protein [Myxococcus stipitatus]|uniref:PHP domain-containing protein n=1 Tax=Myxococcus stipitatus TaxID=83455 RepID=UPI001F20CCAB|nr:PHP domain-containing protein [Myxococcus stipitatus]MCE9666948.1 PHP domain-containing protein [Myxococcus stipitatus]